jgi:phenylacetate-CoA ligase
MIVNSLKQLRSLQKNQYISPSELKALQEKKLKQLVIYAYANVPYYQKLFKTARMLPDEIVTIADLPKIPITRKEQLQGIAQQELFARGVVPEQCIAKPTSGSTGAPFTVFFYPSERDFQILVNLRTMFAAGFKLTDKTTYLGNPVRFPKTYYWFQSFRILRRYYVSSFDTPEKQLSALRQIQTDVLYGYPSTLSLLAHAINEQKVEDVRPKIVFSFAEVLSQKRRELIAAAMHAQVYDILGMIEMGDIAWECPAHQGYHVNSDAVIIEILDDHGTPVHAGQPGRLVCTNLYGYTMPLIRYESRDICVFSEKLCSCGRTLPLLTKIEGRANDMILLPDGTSLIPMMFVIIIEKYREVLQYKVIQESPNHLLVQIVKGKGYTDTIQQRIQEEIEQNVQYALQVRIEIVSHIPREASGKIRTVMSTVIRPEK